MSRLSDLQTFYSLMDVLAAQQGGPVPLADVLKQPVSPRGVYFFFEAGEHRKETGSGLRVTRIGTHGLTSGTTSTLRGRLRQHLGTRAGSGNHRGSIFRLLTGDALIRAGMEPACASWGSKDVAKLGMDRGMVKAVELKTELAASRRIGAMPVLWLAINDAPGPESLRGVIERNSIALISNDSKAPMDAPSSGWLGHHSSRPRVRASGLWNQNHVDEGYNPAFLAELERLVLQSGR